MSLKSFMIRVPIRFDLPIEEFKKKLEELKKIGNVYQVTERDYIFVTNGIIIHLHVTYYFAKDRVGNTKLTIKCKTRREHDVDEFEAILNKLLTCVGRFYAFLTLFEEICELSDEDRKKLETFSRIVRYPYGLGSNRIAIRVQAPDYFTKEFTVSIYLQDFVVVSGTIAIQLDAVSEEQTQLDTLSYILKLFGIDSIDVQLIRPM